MKDRARITQIDNEHGDIKMEVSCLPVSFFKEICSKEMTLGQWMETGRACGLDAVDISMVFLDNHTPVYLKGVKQQMQEYDTKIIMATTYPDFTHPDHMQRERELEYLRRDIAVCSYLGIRYLRVLAGQAHKETSRADGIKWAIEYLRKSEPVGNKFGVELLYEDHAKPGAWDYVDFSHPTDIFLEIFEGIKDTGIGLNFDTGNIVAYGDDPLPVLEKVLDKIVAVHVSDTSEYGKFDPVVIGTGAVPNREIFKVLKANGFDGWLCIEEASGTGVDGVKRAVDFVRGSW